MATVTSLYVEIMGEVPYKTATYEELMNCIKEDNLLERLVYKKQAASLTTNAGKNFVKMDNVQGQVELQDTQHVTNKSKSVAFKSLHYHVVEGTEHVTITIIKRCAGPAKFGVLTEDDTAKGVKDYSPIKEIVYMKADEQQKQINIKITDDDEWEPDKDFYVKLVQHDDFEKLIGGGDTKCKVTIIDNDNPGVIGFAERTIICRPDDPVLELEIERTEGSSGDVSCQIKASSQSEAVGGRPAVEDVDF